MHVLGASMVEPGSWLLVGHRRSGTADWTGFTRPQRRRGAAHRPAAPPAMSVLVASLCIASVHGAAPAPADKGKGGRGDAIPGLTHCGYLPLRPESDPERKLFYMFYEAQCRDAGRAPIMLWLQVPRRLPRASPQACPGRLQACLFCLAGT